MKTFSFALLFSLLTPLFSPTSASGAVIAWDTSAVNTDTSNASQVSIAGSLFLAVDLNSTFTSTSYLVNGVNFTASNANITIGNSGASIAGTAPGTGTYTYASILDGGAYVTPNSQSSTHPIQLSGLTSGHSYELQLWTPYWNFNWATRYSDAAPTGAHAVGESPTVNVGFTGGSVVSQYILGTFTADVGGLQNIYYYGDGDVGMIGAIQVRDVTPVPEPATVAFFALGGLALVLRGRHRHRQLTV